MALFVSPSDNKAISLKSIPAACPESGGVFPTSVISNFPAAIPSNCGGPLWNSVQAISTPTSLKASSNHPFSFAIHSGERACWIPRLIVFVEDEDVLLPLLFSKSDVHAANNNPIAAKNNKNAFFISLLLLDAFSIFIFFTFSFFEFLQYPLPYLLIRRTCSGTRIT